MEVAPSQPLHIFILWQASLTSPLLKAASFHSSTYSLGCDQPVAIFFTMAPYFLSCDRFKCPHECKFKVNYDKWKYLINGDPVPHVHSNLITVELFGIYWAIEVIPICLAEVPKVFPKLQMLVVEEMCSEKDSVQGWEEIMLRNYELIGCQTGRVDSIFKKGPEGLLKWSRH